jgi:hypothetical protein
MVHLVVPLPELASRVKEILAGWGEINKDGNGPGLARVEQIPTREDKGHG